ncbi:hypothetical protein D1816_12460 [Aquimarina sp. AD10]|uniref:Uncharacterized protein n=1 Tax=Aquimarina aggregata TaxID=1642818 RepID=A0A162YLT2_9FLAO|nr:MULTISPECIES: hypothetical protein [Aquimarina]AXT61124.1 hypothetical protein D1816_12460 [Aquimarina sp. AD10]KZS39216.1 hypothetical protein AWE51_11730 [Aquimarina aggregata]RKN02260.1 hypothetical protein D7033_02150 [Aquimarina sp. AD10]
MNNSNTIDPRLISILRISTFLIFLGRAYQHLVWDPPYRTLLWDEAILKGIVENVFNTSWHEYVTSLAADTGIGLFTKTVGVLYLLCAIVALFIKPNMKRLGKAFLLGGSFGLLILAILYCKEKFLHVGQFFEYMIQFMSPVLFYMVLFTTIEFKKIRLIALIAIALTFSCHGLYAVGYYPRPGTFIDMTLNTLPISEPSAHAMLKIAGILDFVIAIAIFIPRISYPALIYAFIWGGLTAIARLVGHFHIEFLWNSFNQWTWEVLIRLPHALIPLFVMIVDKPEVSFFKRKISKNNPQIETLS